MLKGFGFDFNNIFLVQWDRWMVGWLAGWLAGEWLWFHNDTKKDFVAVENAFLL